MSVQIAINDDGEPTTEMDELTDDIHLFVVWYGITAIFNGHKPITCIDIIIVLVTYYGCV